jgi:hypothetical protein
MVNTIYSKSAANFTGGFKLTMRPQLKETLFGEIPEEWEVVRLGR